MVPFVAGQHVGNYEITGPSLDGGFRAKQHGTGRDAHIKLLAHSFLPGTYAPQIDAARRVSHPNVAGLFDVEPEDSVLYAATEWMEGETLRQRLSKARLPVQKAVTFALQIANGLAAAHAAGVVHADLKPENIVITKEGNVKIAGLGLANLTDADNELPLVADYVSPEQVRGEPETPASDIFSLGVILYEMLSGTRPFLRPTLTATTTAILKADPPYELPPGVTPALGRIVRHCLAKAPANRFTSASDAAFALESFWNLALPHDRVRKLHKKGLTGIFLACAVGGVLGMGAGALIARRYLRPVAAAPLSFRRITGSGHDSSPSASYDGKTIVYSSDRDGTPRIWAMQSDTGQETVITSGPDRFPRLSPDGKSVLFVRQEDAGGVLYSVPISGGATRKLMVGVQSADWLRNGGIVWLRVTRNAAGYVSVLGIANASGEQAAEIARIDKQVLAHPRCSPDGSLVAAVAGPGEAIHLAVFVARASGGGQQYLLSPPANAGDLSGLTWAPDSTNVIYFQSENRATGNGSGNEWAGGGAHVVRQNAKTGGAAVIGYSQQNARLVERLGSGRLLIDSGSRRENLEEFSLARATEHSEPRPLTLGDITDQDPVYAHGGESIFFSSFRGGETGVWELLRTTGAARRVIPSGANDMEPFPFSDGKRILWTSDREGHFEIFWASLANPHPRAVTHDGVDADHASITPDDAWVVYNSKNPARRGVWKIRQTGIDDTRLATGETRWPAVSPDGKYVLYTIDQGSQKRVIHVLALDSGKLLAPDITLDVPHGSIGSAVGRAQWMPGGGTAIAYIAQDDRGRTGVYVQDWPSGARRALGGFSPTRTTESFALSPGAASLILAALDQSTGLVEVSNVPGMSIR